MRLEKPRMAHYQQVMRADEVYRAAGEEAYCGLRGRAGYAAWLISIARQARPEAIHEGMNPNEIWLLLDDHDELCGFGQLRLYDTEDVTTWAGNIGYSVPPDRRGNGYATEMLTLLLDMAFERGREEVSLTCDTDNEPSRRVIEKCGGAFVGLYTQPPFHKRVYRFTKDEWNAYKRLHLKE